MDAYAAPESPVSWQGLLGYLNFADGKPDIRFQQQFHAAVRVAAQNAAPALADLLDAQLTALHESGTAAFRDVTQARAVLSLALRDLPPAYRRHHADLLAHQGDADLFTPFFLARACEAVLAAYTAAPADAPERVTVTALNRLNDFVGYRPVAVLETRPASGFYDHERLRPIPLYLRGVGVAAGRYQDLVSGALTLIDKADPDLLDEAQFDPALLDELALDPRAYDHNHPANRRPNYVFGEWDPHHLDGQGRYRRFVVRQTTLDALIQRVQAAPEAERDDRRFEAAAVLAGTMLMAAAISGRTPTSFDSSVTLKTIVERIARLRDEFYQQLLPTVPEPLRTRLREDAERTRQPFGGARQHLNQVNAQERALQLQERHLALIFAALGYPEASRRRARSIATPSVRIVSEARLRLTEADRLAHQGRLPDAAALLPEVESLVHRGIDCGAIVDPWNMLGFQGLFPLFQAREDSIHDPRIDELLGLVGDLLDAYARLIGDAAAQGLTELQASLTTDMRRVAAWWDRYAGYEVQDLPRVHGGEAAEAAEHVANALARWRQAGTEDGATAPSPAFWRQYRDGFRAPSAFARVVTALLDRGDHPSSLALLMFWLDQAPEVPLADGDYSFHALALRWVREVTGGGREPADKRALLGRFFDHLEANAEAYWDVPELTATLDGPEAEDGEDVYGAAYDDVTFRDSADDGTEGAVLGDAAPGADFLLEHQEEELLTRLQFLATVAGLWRAAAPAFAGFPEKPRSWLATAEDWEPRLLGLLDELHAVAVPAPPDSFEGAMEYERRRGIKEHLLDAGIAAALAAQQALRSLRSVAGAKGSADGWEPLAAALERAIERGDAGRARKVLHDFLPRFRREPLLYVPISEGGHPRQVLRSRSAQALLHTLVEQLPRLGLLRETFALVQTARAMEQSSPPEGRRVTEFDRLFPAALQASVEAALDALRTGPESPAGDELLELLKGVVTPYLNLWVEHSRTLRLSVLETVGADDWDRLRDFIRRYGRELLTAPVLNYLANVRAVLHRGVGTWFDSLPNQENPPERFLNDLGRSLPRESAVRFVEWTLQAVAENYDEYRDYNTTTTQSDYGENLHLLLDFLRLKTTYDRDGWRLRPLLATHEVLCRRQRTADAARWQEGIADYTRRQAEGHLRELALMEATHGLRLRSVRDRLGERFVAPLAVDRLCALLTPAWQATRAGAGEENPAFAQLLRETEAFAAVPVGVGLEVPAWLRRLEAEVYRLRHEPPRQAADRVPARLTLAELRRQLTQDWAKPLDGE